MLPAVLAGASSTFLVSPSTLHDTAEPRNLGAGGRIPEDDHLSDTLLDAAQRPDELATDAGSAPDPPTGPLDIPAPMLAAYTRTANRLSETNPGCGLHWSLLASIGRIESGHARNGNIDVNGNTATPILGPRLSGGPGVAEIPDTDAGALDGDPVWDRAVGAMQFIPTTWRKYAVDGNGDGVANPHNVADSLAAAGNYLCSGGDDLRDPRALAAAVFRYNHSESYVRTVLIWAAAYARGVTPTPVELAPLVADVLAGARQPAAQPSEPHSEPPNSGEPPPAESSKPSREAQPPGGLSTPPGLPLPLPTNPAVPPLSSLPSIIAAPSGAERPSIQPLSTQPPGTTAQPPLTAVVTTTVPEGTTPQAPSTPPLPIPPLVFPPPSSSEHPSTTTQAPNNAPQAPSPTPQALSSAPETPSTTAHASSSETPSNRPVTGAAPASTPSTTTQQTGAGSSSSQPSSSTAPTSTRPSGPPQPCSSTVLDRGEFLTKPPLLGTVPTPGTTAPTAAVPGHVVYVANISGQIEPCVVPPAFQPAAAPLSTATPQ